MKVLKKMAIILGSSSFVLGLTLTAYNSVVINNNSFMSENMGVAFSKRLDEVNGKVTIGRMAASTRKWESLIENKRKNTTKVLAKSSSKTSKRVFEKEQKVLDPTIKEDLNLTLAKVFHKKKLKEGTFSGSAKTVDGVIEEIFVNLPNGDQIEINTYDRMVGNVFTYDDPATGEVRSGMLYESGKNAFTVVLSNDSQYQGMKMEFKTSGQGLEYAQDHYENTQNWQMDQQNNNSQLAVENVDNSQNYEQNEIESTEQAEENPSFGYNFNS
ncbi:MAG: hypothetical protein N4A33_08860 [Bacteriovoracaceae bacterium]|jgi:deoxyadenosine/deoxycytidine kinase|nr:hypothetical protein [Bacteriovoracaceae bacterium]